MSEKKCDCDPKTCINALLGKCCRQKLQKKSVDPLPAVVGSSPLPSDYDDADLFPDGDPLSEDL